MKRQLTVGEKVFSNHISDHSFQWIFRDSFFWGWLVWSPCCPRNFQEFSPALQHSSLKVSVLWNSAFFIWSNSHSHMLNTGKIIALTIQNFVRKVMSLPSNMLSRFLPRSKCLLISWPHSLSAVVLTWENKVCHFPFYPIYLPWRDGTGCHDLSFLNVEF